MPLGGGGGGEREEISAFITAGDFQLTLTLVFGIKGTRGRCTPTALETLWY